MDLVNSTIFIKKPLSVTAEEECLLYMKEILCSRLFLGFYQERRYVSALQQYRDVVVINSEEKDLLEDINKIKRKCKDIVNVKWVGITGPESCTTNDSYCFWVKLTNLAFDHYWFQIKHVKLIEGEILLQLKCIRKSLPLSVDSSSSYSAENKIFFRPISDEIVPANSLTNYVNILTFYIISKNFLGLVQKTCCDAFCFFQPYVNWKNSIIFIKTTFALFIVLISEIFSIIGSLGNFILKLVREITNLLEVISPIVIQFLDFCTKIVGGFFILLAGMLNSRNTHVFLNRKNSKNYHLKNLNSPKSLSYNTNWKTRNRVLREELCCDQH